MKMNSSNHKDIIFYHWDMKKRQTINGRMKWTYDSFNPIPIGFYVFYSLFNFTFVLPTNYNFLPFFVLILELNLLLEINRSKTSE